MRRFTKTNKVPPIPPISTMSPPLRCLLVCATLWCLGSVQAAPDSVVTLNEIFYHPPDPVPPAAVAAPEWIELHNQMSIRVDLGGWSLRGGIDFTFPEGTIMEPGAYLVVSAVPNSPVGALGPLVGKLDNSGEEIRLHERWGRMMDRVHYGDSGSWPIEPDGGGPSLAKRRPDHGSESAASWITSAQMGGSPGAENFPLTTETAPRVVFNAGASWKFEPTGNDPPAQWIQLSGFSDASWTSGAAPLGTANPAGPPTPVTVLPAGRSAYYLRKSFAWSGTMPNARLLLSGTIKGTAQCYFNGVLAGSVSGNGSQGILLNAAGLVTGANLVAIKLTPAAPLADVALDLSASILDGVTAVAPAMAPLLPGNVVINEIAYHARPTFADPGAGVPYAKNDTEWIELHNPGTQTVSLTGWRLSDAVDYVFPAGAQISAGGFLILNQTQFSGSLSNTGDRIRLRNDADALVDEVPYVDGGRWPELADGGGSTLELTDPHADRRSPESWAASDETSRGTWQTITYRAAGSEPPGSNYPDNWHEFLLGFLDAGEALIDDVSVIEDPDGAPVQVIQNGNFESDPIGQGAAKWRLLGTHKLSQVVANPDGPGRVLRLIATAEAEHTYNAASTTLVGNRAIDPAKTYEISFRAKWLSGSPQLNSRLYLNRASRTSILTLPIPMGTPGATNGSRVANAGPAFDGLRHSPLVPAASQPVRISISVADPDGIQEVVVFYSLNQGAWQRTNLGGDGGGRFMGVLPGQVSGSQVQFYIQATDGAGSVAQFPRGGPASRALYKVGDGAVATQAVRNKMRLLMNAADANELHNPVHSVSNFRWPCTVIYNDREVWYDAAVRLRSAPFGRQGNRAGWNIQFPSDHLFRGVQSSVVIDGAFNMPKGDGTGWIENTLGATVNEMLYQAIANRAGNIPATYDDVVFFQTPRTTEGNRRAQLKMTRFNPAYLEEQFPSGADGMLFKQELIYYPTSTVDGNVESLKNAYNAVRDTEIRSFGSSKEGWRWNYLVQTNADVDDYSGLMALGSAFDAPPQSLYAQTFSAMDTDNWMRVFALSALIGLADTYNNGLAHNAEIYIRPSDHKAMLFPWDQDHAFYYAPTYSIFGLGTHRLGAIINLPQNRRLFAGHLRQLCQTAFTNTFLDPVINHLSSTPVADKPLYAVNFRNWVAARRTFVLDQIATQFPAISFAITTNGGTDFSTTQTSATLQGSGWIDVREIRVSRNGAPAQSLEVTWLDGQTWQILVPVLAGPNALALTAINHDGAAVGSDTIAITNLGTVEAAAAGNFLISEINYHPAGIGAEEFIEFVNVGSHTLDLTGVHFSEGILFDFTGSAITMLAPGQRVLVVENLAAFTARYGNGLPVAGEFGVGKNLSNSGEHLILRDRGGAVIVEFSYDDHNPWPNEADGAGSSLTLIRPEFNPDSSLPTSWRPSRLPGGSPGTSDALLISSYPSLLEYAFTALPTPAASDQTFDFTWGERLGADDVTLQLETSTNLASWTPDPGDGSEIQVLYANSSDGTRSVLARLVDLSNARKYVRIRVVPR